MYDPLSLLKEKYRLLQDLSQLLSNGEKKVIERDGHSKRLPRPCGITIHPGIGCTCNCVYCYISDMGFPTNSISEYPLSGLQLTYALLSNPSFVPTHFGTFIAVGSVTEPFHPRIKHRTLDYLYHVAKYLKNPIQFSTKFPLSDDDIDALIECRKFTSISPLITIVTLKHYKVLEPGAPDPLTRFSTIESLRNANFEPMLFLRPVFPRLTRLEIDDIIKLADRYGACGVVVGSLRITKRIYGALKSVGIDLDVDEKRLSSRQIPVSCREDIDVISKTVREYGLKLFRSACCANAYIGKVPCISLCFSSGLCTNCNNGCRSKLPRVDAAMVSKALALLNTYAVVREVRDDCIVVSKVSKSTRIVLQTIFRRIIREY